MCLKSFSKDTPPTDATMYTHAPMGGVISAIVILRVITIPKCSGSIPAATANGLNTGVSNTRAATSSINMPTRKIITLMSNSTMVGVEA